MHTSNEIDFLRTYKDYIYYFGMLERNIGYSLFYCQTKLNRQNPDKWLSASFDARVKKLLRMASEVGVEQKFDAWKTNIETCRHLRNIVAHGAWEWREHLDKPILYHAPEIDNGKGEFSTDEFNAQLDFLKSVLSAFGKLQKLLELACENHRDNWGQRKHIIKAH